MHALLDGDILRYEVGFAAEAGWRATKETDDLPPWEYVRDLLRTRIENILAIAGADEHTIFITEGHTFRFDLATVKPYKGTRKSAKPWHFDNLTVFLKHVLGATVVTGVEADDQMAALASSDPDNYIICSRDKDLRQVHSWFYSWELGKQPSFGPVFIDELGSLTLTKSKPRKITGTGFAFFCSQVLTGDAVDNIPGLPGCGPVAAYEALSELLEDDTVRDIQDKCNTLIWRCADLYRGYYGDDWKERLTEQGRLCWLTRTFNPDGSPVLWTPEDYLEEVSE
jgi:hypothetical protein